MKEAEQASKVFLRLGRALRKRDRLVSTLEETNKEIRSSYMEISQITFGTHMLSGKQEQIARLLKDNPGISNKELAAMLNISERTIKFHMTALLGKFKLENRKMLLEALRGLP
jgi:two-component system, NarL family, nitrate/nitrite response regulator NarL